MICHFSIVLRLKYESFHKYFSSLKIQVVKYFVLQSSTPECCDYLRINIEWTNWNKVSYFTPKKYDRECTIIYDQLELNLVLMIRKQIKCIKIMRNISYTNNFPVLKS